LTTLVVLHVAKRLVLDHHEFVEKAVRALLLDTCKMK
jgi:hypothetical protein